MLDIVCHDWFGIYDDDIEESIAEKKRKWEKEKEEKKEREEEEKDE